MRAPAQPSPASCLRPYHRQQTYSAAQRPHRATKQRPAVSGGEGLPCARIAAHAAQLPPMTHAASPASPATYPVQSGRPAVAVACPEGAHAHSLAGGSARDPARPRSHRLATATLGGAARLALVCAATAHHPAAGAHHSGRPGCWHRPKGGACPSRGRLRRPHHQKRGGSSARTCSAPPRPPSGPRFDQDQQSSFFCASCCRGPAWLGPIQSGAMQCGGVRGCKGAQAMAVCSNFVYEPTTAPAPAPVLYMAEGTGQLARN